LTSPNDFADLTYEHNQFLNAARSMDDVYGIAPANIVPLIDILKVSG
jgi:hypothetical protein